MAHETVTAWTGQVFDVMRPEDWPQDADGDGRRLRYATSEHDEMMMPQAIEVMDAERRWAIYEPQEVNGKKLAALMRPQDTDGSGNNLRFTPRSHERNVPQAIEVVDGEGRRAVYVPLQIEGKAVRPQR
jgi:hypothetical protein